MYLFLILDYGRTIRLSGYELLKLLVSVAKLWIHGVHLVVIICSFKFNHMFLVSTIVTEKLVYTYLCAVNVVVMT